MSRPLRLQLPGALYHVMSRGNDREDIFLDAVDRLSFLELLGSVCDRFPWRAYAYCLMGNHYHLVVETLEANLSRAMRQLNGVYAQRFNRRHGRVGHVFQGRYKAMLVEREAYLLELARYLVLNPVRARLVQDPADWPWSSHRAILGQTDSPPWLDVAALRAHFGNGPEQAVAVYRRFVLRGIGVRSPWEDLTHQICLGGEQFLEHFLDTLRGDIPESVDEMPKPQRQILGPPLDAYVQRDRDRRVAMALAYRSGQYTMKAIAAHFGVHYMTVSRAVRWFESQGKRRMLDCET